ncbi:helix-turn-helix domain containing protein [Pseudomonas aeruginosa]|nr:helix-turn-helix domain containing protein [Pseudomonas aeruginosa]
MSTRRRTPRSDGESTRARILEVAGRLFAQHGYANTASKAICEEAGADLAAINYHFGSRDALAQGGAGRRTQAVRQPARPPRTGG